MRCESWSTHTDTATTHTSILYRQSCFYETVRPGTAPELTLPSCFLELHASTFKHRRKLQLIQLLSLSPHHRQFAVLYRMVGSTLTMPRSALTSSFSVTDANNEVVCPLRNQDGSSCRKRCLGVSAHSAVHVPAFAAPSSSPLLCANQWW